MSRTARLAVMLGALALARCGEEAPVSEVPVGEHAAARRLYVRAAGMVKALGIT